MTRRSTSLLTGLGLAALLGLGLVGCATPTDAGARDGGDGTSTTAEPGDEQAEYGAAWLDDGRMVGVVTLGSSSCVPFADQIDANGDGLLTVTLVEAEDEPCTRDMVPRVSLIGLPETVDPADDLEIVVTGSVPDGVAFLAGVPGLVAPDGPGEYLPTAGWTSDDGEFAVVTWGSSTCPEVVENVEVTGPDAVTLTFVEPDEARTCTLDMAPRGTVAYAEGMDGMPNAVLSIPSMDAETTIVGPNWVPAAQ